MLLGCLTLFDFDFSSTTFAAGAEPLKSKAVCEELAVEKPQLLEELKFHEMQKDWEGECICMRMQYLHGSVSRLDGKLSSFDCMCRIS